MAPVLAPPNRFVSELAGDQGTTSEVAMTQQTLAGLAVDRLIAVIGAELPAGFGVAAGRSVVAVGNPVPVRPAAVVAARSALDHPALTPGAAGTALEIGRRRLRPPDRHHYEAAGLCCVWWIELSRRPGYRGPVPVVFAASRFGGRWRERFAVRGAPVAVPLCLGPAGRGDPLWISVELDPGWLT
jgi:hypothetical protein